MGLETLVHGCKSRVSDAEGKNSKNAVGSSRFGRAPEPTRSSTRQVGPGAVL
jgi:hypothetical protein